jgi:hypothetical protein
MSSLPRSILKLGEEIVAYYGGHSVGGTPPYLVYVYPPDKEYQVRGDLKDLQVWLQARGVTAVAVSLADLFWQAVDESGFFDQIVAEEQRRSGDAAVLAEVMTSISQILQGPPSLADRVLRKIGDTPERSATFLYRAGALYPVFRTSALLDDLRERLPQPVVLLYPGRVVGLYGLSFMGRCEPAHGYRATIIARENP